MRFDIHEMFRNYRKKFFKKYLISVLVIVSVFKSSQGILQEQISTQTTNSEVGSWTDSSRSVMDHRAGHLTSKDQGTLLKSLENSGQLKMANIVERRAKDHSKIFKHFADEDNSETVDITKQNNTRNSVARENPNNARKSKVLENLDSDPTQIIFNVRDNIRDISMNKDVEEPTKLLENGGNTLVGDHFVEQTLKTDQENDQKIVNNISSNGHGQNQHVSAYRIENRESKKVDWTKIEDESKAPDEDDDCNKEILLRCRSNFTLDLTFDNIESWELKCGLVLSSDLLDVVIVFTGLKENKFILEFASSETDYRSTRDEDNLSPVCIPCKVYHSLCLYFGNSYISQPKYVSLHPYLVMGDKPEKRLNLGSLDLILSDEVAKKPVQTGHKTNYHDIPKVHDMTQAIVSDDFGNYEHQPIVQYWNPSNSYHGNTYHGNNEYQYHGNSEYQDHGNNAYYSTAHAQYSSRTNNVPHYNNGYHGNSHSDSNDLSKSTDYHSNAYGDGNIHSHAHHHYSNDVIKSHP